MRRRYLQPLVERHFAPSFPGLRRVEDLLRMDARLMAEVHPYCLVRTGDAAGAGAR
jgi:hypothetical protein